MKRICKECGHEFDDYSYLKGKDDKICDDCRFYLNLAANNDDYNIFVVYLSSKEIILEKVD